jgi:hypothetical protein
VYIMVRFDDGSFGKRINQTCFNEFIHRQTHLRMGLSRRLCSATLLLDAKRMRSLTKFTIMVHKLPRDGRQTSFSEMDVLPHDNS